MEKDQAKEKIQQLIEKYNSIVSEGKKPQYSEADVGSKFILPLLSALGWDITRIEDVKEQRRTLTGVADYSLLNRGSASKIFLELKKFDEDLDGSRRVGGKVKSFPQIAIDYAWQSRADWAVLTNFEELRLYYSRVKKPQDGLIFKLKYHDYLTNFDKLWLLSKEGAISGLLDTYEKRRLRRDVDEELLKDLVYCRKLLVLNVGKNHPKLSKDEINEATQKILDRLMFIRSCEDRLIIPAESLWTQFSVWQKIAIDKTVRTFMMDLKNIFRDFDAVYNGKLFAPHLCEDLRVDNDVLEAMLTSLYNYNFDLIPVDVLGNAYELYIGTIVKEKEGTLKEDELTLVEDPTVRKKHGIYYTPEYVVDYIVRNTLGTMLEKCKTIEDVSRIKVLDPACGSGSFLIKAFDVIKEWYDHYNKQNKLAATPNTLDAHFQAIPNVEEKILTENLYGVDLDPQAAEITILNLSLKAVKTKKRLPHMGDRIRCGNSLISSAKENLELHFGDHWEEKKPFDWQAEFPEVFSEGGFDVVIGNPPYVRVDNLKEEDKAFWKTIFNSSQGKYDVYYLFIESAFKWLRNDGLCGFIVPNKFCAASSAKVLRKMLIENSSHCTVISVSQLDVFKDAANYPVLLILKKGKNVDRINIGTVLKQNELLNKNFVLYSVEKEDLDVLPYRILPININQQQFHLALRLLKENQNLSQYLKISEALRIPKTLEKVNFNDFEIVKQFQFNKWSPIDKGSYISEEDLKKVTSFTSERYNNLLRDKIVIAEDALTITATFDNNKHVPQGGVYFGVLKNENISLKYILALLNSKLLSFVYNVLFSGMHMGGGYLRYRTEFLEQLPIMPASEDQQQDVIKLADKMLSLNQQLRTVNVDFDRYLTEPIMGYINFKDYYKRLDVKDKEALEKASTGSVKRVKVEEQDSWLMFKVDYFIRKGKIKEEFIEVPILRCRFEDVYWKKFLLYVFQNYKKRWGSGNLLSIILNTTIPCFDKNPDRNNQIIKRIMEEFLKAVEEKERLEKEINQTDNTIDSKVYELYGLTSEEIALVENHKN